MDSRRAAVARTPLPRRRHLHLGPDGKAAGRPAAADQRRAGALRGVSAQPLQRLLAQPPSARLAEALQIDVDVSKLIGGHVRLSLEESPSLADRPAIPDTERSHEPRPVQEEDRERRRSEAAPDHGLIPWEPGADVLEVEVVLLRPEPRNLRERPALAGDRPPDRVPVPESRVVVLHAHRGLEERVPEAGTVPRRVDVGCVRPPELVDHDATIAANAGCFREL